MASQLLKHLTPDEQFTWTRAQMLEEIPGFIFSGPGWYCSQGSWMLIIATHTQDVYTLQVFYDRDPRLSFLAVAEAPVRTQESVISSIKRPVSYGGLIVLLVGMLVMLPLSAFLLHKFGNWGVLMLLAYVAVWGYITRLLDKKGAKKDESTSS